MLQYPIVFASGFCALVYQIVWMRLLVHVFGLSVHSTTTVVCAFMGGLGLGSYLAPRLLRRWKGNPWALYALIEIGIGITAALLPLTIAPIKWAYVAGSVVESAFLLTAIKFVLSVSVMLVPTTLMGLTLPVLVQARLGGERTAVGTRTVGYLYGFNTAGAAVGCVLVGFVLLYQFGIRATVAAIAALNLLIALVSFVAYGRRPVDVRAEDEPVVETPLALTTAPGDVDVSQPRHALAILALYGLIGMLSLGYEIAWFRVLVFYLQSATYSFSILLATYLIGLALGSLAFSRLLEPRIPRSSAFATTVKWIAIGQLLLALMTSATLMVSKAVIPWLWAWLVGALGADTWLMISMQKLCIASVIVIPPTLVMGATFPMVVKLYKASGASDAKSVAHLYAANTAGAVIGSVITGFFMFDVFGMQRTLTILSFLSLCIGLGLLFAFRSARYGVALRAAAGGVAVGWVAIVALEPPRLVESLIEDTRGLEVIFFRESAADITMVGQSSTARELIYHDGRGTCSTWAGGNYVARQEVFSAMIQNPGAKRILIISMGCGNTASAFAAFPIERLDIVDLSPSVFEAANYFEQTNLRVIEDPRVHTISEDGRNYLLTTRRMYDIISIELPSIHTAGVVNLYTREFYELARSRLTPGGVLSQWVDANQTGRQVGYILLNTMRTVFPDTIVWANKWSWWFNGVNSPPGTACQIDYSAARRQLSIKRVAHDMRVVRTNFADVFANIVASPQSSSDRVRHARVITDDHTYVDFLVPRLTTGAAFGGGIGYYNSPLRDIFYKAWKFSPHVSTRENRRKGDPWVENSFHPEEEVIAGRARAVDECLGGFPDRLRQKIKELQPPMMRGRAGWRPTVLSTGGSTP